MVGEAAVFVTQIKNMPMKRMHLVEVPIKKSHTVLSQEKRIREALGKLSKSNARFYACITCMAQNPTLRGLGEATMVNSCKRKLMKTMQTM